MNYNSMLSTLGSLSSSIASAIIPGAAALPSLLKAGKAAVEAFQSLKEANGGTAPADAEASHQALVTKVNAHADATFGRAEGQD